VAAVVKQLAKGLKITWKLHTAYQPQSSGIKRINQILKIQMSKLSGNTPDMGTGLAISFT
jgi:hypothetical protein